MDEFPYRLPLLLGGAQDSMLKAAGMPENESAQRWILAHPGAYHGILATLLEAGIQAVLAPTAGAFPLTAPGLEEQTEFLIPALMELSRAGVPAGTPVGGAIGPSGLFVPPLGQADFDDIYTLYREQVRAFEKAGASFLLIEAQTSLADMRAAALASRTSNLPVLVSIDVDENGKTLTGGRLLPALLTLQAMGVEAVGLEGGADIQTLSSLLEEASQHTAVPLLVRPDVRRNGVLLSPEAFANGLKPLLLAGGRVLSAGAGSSTAHYAALRDAAAPFGPPSFPVEPDCNAASIEGEAFFLGDDIAFSEPIPCTSHLDEDFIDLDDGRANTALVEVESVDDAKILSQFGGMTRLPIAVHCDSKPVLDAALRYFQGRLIVDSDCQLEEEAIIPLCNKYGAILY